VKPRLVGGELHFEREYGIEDAEKAFKDGVFILTEVKKLLDISDSVQK
jgi:hypothetical protein